ncbi:MAG: hypothetical protein IKW39_05025, partial [Alphaproteobacteria bacterium]|nr:hypothetical protein [Alphaproteobacteria bacterium]
DGNLFYKYLTVDESRMFDYENVYQNLTKGVHPPFYHIVLHTISSVFAGSSDIWIGLSINLVILVLFVGLMYKLLGLCFDNDKVKVFLGGLFIVFMPVLVEMEMFIRMYLLVMSAMLVVIYNSFAVIKENKITLCRAGYIFLGMFLASFSHFYSLIYGFVLWMFVSGYLICKKEIKIFFVYGFSMLLGVLCMFYVYPLVFDVLLNSSRGKETSVGIGNYDFGFLLFSYDYFLNRMSGAVLGIHGQWQWLILLGLAGIYLVERKCIKDKHVFNEIDWIMIFYSFVCGIIISVLAPEMQKLGGRYYAVSGMVLCVPILKVLLGIIDCGKWGRGFFGIIFGAIVIHNIVIGLDNPYLFRDEEGKLLSQIVKDKKVVISGGSIYTLTYYVMGSKKVYWGKTDDYEKALKIIKGDEVSKGDILMIYAGMGNVKNSKKLLDGQDNKLKFLDLIYIGARSYEVYERV